MAQAPFLFSIAGLSLSLAGLAGLVAGLRRGSDMRPIEVYRLREIVEFAFATSLIALLGVPLSELTTDDGQTVRLLGVVGVAYVLIVWAWLEARRRRQQIALRESPNWLIVVLVVNGSAIAAGLAALATGNVAAAEFMLLALLARPMAAFLLVLGLLGRSSESPGEQTAIRPVAGRPPDERAS